MFGMGKGGLVMRLALFAVGSISGGNFAGDIFSEIDGITWATMNGASGLFIQPDIMISGALTAFGFGGWAAWWQKARKLGGER